MGRVLIKKEKMGTAFFQATDYTYNLDGSVSTETYPTSNVMSYVYSPAQRPISFRNTVLGVNYVSTCTTTPCYTPSGALQNIIYDAAMTVSNSYNDRLQPLFLSATGPAGTILSLSYNFHAGAGDNGNVYQIVNGKDGNRTQNFLYDSLNRIQQAYTNGTNWGETYSPSATAPGVPPTTPGIDAWGNLTNRSGVTGKTNYEGLSCSASNNNQLTGCSITYDAAGNMIQNGSAAYTYDAENRLLTAAGYAYSYDGDGNRVLKSNGSTGTIYWRGADGEVIDEGNLSDIMQEEYVYFGGKRVVRWDVPTGHRHYYFSDHLGSSNVVTDNAGNVQDESDYYPYGGEIQVTNTYTNTYKFTGKERDAESGLDEFGARYFTSTMGRFMTPDWAAKPTAVPYAVYGDPQSLNLYSYVRNNPMSKADGDGHDAVAIAAELTGPLAECPVCEVLVWGGALAIEGYAAYKLHQYNSEKSTTKKEPRAPTGSQKPAEASPANLGSAPNPNGEKQDKSAANKEGAQDKKLTKGEIENLKQNTQQSPEEIKQETMGTRKVGKLDLYKNDQGEIVVKPKGSSGPGEPTGYTTEHLKPPVAQPDPEDVYKTN